MACPYAVGWRGVVGVAVVQPRRAWLYAGGWWPVMGRVVVEWRDVE